MRGIFVDRTIGAPRTGFRVLLLLSMVLGSLVAATPSAAEPGLVRGVALDANTGEPIAGAWIFAVVPGESRRADVRKFERVRRIETDAEGSFEFPPAETGVVDHVFSFFSTPRAERFHFYHPNYGLVWGREAQDGSVTIKPSLRDAHLRQEDAKTMCLGRWAADEMRETVRSYVCPPADPTVYPNGRARAEGALDRQGRRTGPWIFRREDGSIQAVGVYEAGGAVGEWGFHPTSEN